ncbi:MAG: hypothetical protein HXY34_06900 [Candidatus Thorarchaeota archaeon]|nr:hypothetical protein [Candidatus Thorarchaeota archaeon]
MSELWTRWLLFASLGVTVAGACFAFVFPYFLPQVLEVYFFELTGEGFASLSADELRFFNLLSGVIGGTMFGWGLLLTMLSLRLQRVDQDWAWAALAVSAIGWFIVDTTATVLVRSLTNTILNLTILLVILPPLVAQRARVVQGMKQLMR